MSQAGLKLFLRRILRELESPNEILRQESNKEAHTFYLSRGRLLTQVYKQLDYDKVDYDKLKVKKATDEYFKVWESKSEGLIARGSASGIDSSTSRRLSSKGKYITLVFVAGKEESSIFKKVTRHKQLAQKDFHSFVSTLYGGSFNPSNFLDVTHEQSSVVSRQAAQKANTSIDSHIETLDAATQLNIRHLEKSRALKLSLIKDNARDTISVSLGSASFNRGAEAYRDRRYKDNAIKSLKRAIKRLEKPLLESPGSDSFIDKTKKKFLRDALGRFATAKNAVIKSEDTKPKGASGKAEKIITPKILKGSDLSVSLDGFKGKKFKTKTSAINLQSLVPQINLKLKEQVAKNMGSPKLNYRTGRFANSVEVRNISTTAKGHPSIAYTYMRYPYEVFEYPGSNSDLASVHRDPRNLIQQSIREIAKGLITQKFYMRRV